MKAPGPDRNLLLQQIKHKKNPKGIFLNLKTPGLRHQSNRLIDKEGASNHDYG